MNIRETVPRQTDGLSVALTVNQIEDPDCAHSDHVVVGGGTYGKGDGSPVKTVYRVDVRRCTACGWTWEEKL